MDATPLTVLAGFFETLQLFLSRSEDVHVNGCNMDFFIIMEIIYIY